MFTVRVKIGIRINICINNTFYVSPTLSGSDCYFKDKRHAKLDEYFSDKLKRRWLISIARLHPNCAW